MYYDQDFITAVNFFDQDGESQFGSCWLVKKSKSNLKYNMCRLLCIEQTGQGIEEGTWDAIHVVTTNVAGTQATYTAVSTVFVMINLNQQQIGAMQVGGHLNKKKDISNELNPKEEIGQ